jgi:hypothetical protein
MVENIWGSIVRTLDLETKKIIRREIYVIETAHERRWQLMTKLYEALNEIQKENLYVYVTSNLNNKNPLYTGLIRDDKKLYGGKKKYIFNICKTLTENDLIGNQYIKITPFYKTKISNYMSYYDNILPNYIVTKEPFTKKLQKNFFVSDGAWLWTTADLFILNKHNILPKCGFFSYLYRRKNFRRVSIEENLALKKLLKKTFVFN